ncbi:hypothetical protein HDU93_001410 [Gonapodya sp. JEL0774]|nr:hypothetical protein HDU93_001410 [Gonapodya sp. JEL0774]
MPPLLMHVLHQEENGSITYDSDPENDDTGDSGYPPVSRSNDPRRASGRGYGAEFDGVGGEEEAGEVDTEEPDQDGEGDYEDDLDGEGDGEDEEEDGLFENGGGDEQQFASYYTTPRDAPPAAVAVGETASYYDPAEDDLADGLLGDWDDGGVSHGVKRGRDDEEYGDGEEDVQYGDIPTDFGLGLEFDEVVSGGGGGSNKRQRR